MPTARFQPSFAAGVLGPGLHGRIDIAKYDVALKVGRNVFVHAHGGVSNRAGTRYVGAVEDQTLPHRLVPFERDDTDTAVLVFGDSTLRIVSNGAYVLSSGSPYQVTSPYTSAQAMALDHAQSIDVLFLAHPGVQQQRLGRFGVTDWRFEDLQINPTIPTETWIGNAAAAPEIAAITQSGTYSAPKASRYTYKIAATVGGVESFPSSPKTIANVYDIDTTAAANVVSWAAVTGATQYHVYRLKDGEFGLVNTTASLSLSDNGSSFTAATKPKAITVTAGAAGAETYRYVVAPVVDGVEGFPSEPGQVTAAQSLDVAGAKNTITWLGRASLYRVYRERNGVFGYIGFTTKTTFIDDNIAPELNETPIEEATLFQGAGRFPSRVSLAQQRLIFAGSDIDPETVWASRVGEYQNFTRSQILLASDRMEVGLSGERINRIRGLLQLRELLVFASSGEFSVTGPEGTLSATNPVVTQYGYAGSAAVRPLVVDDTALFVDRTGRGVRDLRYAFEQDGYAGNDLSIFASHFFEGKTIAGWCYAQSPFSIIWVCLNDGTLLSLTYKREHQVWAWCEHDVGGAVESLASVREGSNDAVYMIVRRVVNGATKRYIERMADRDFTDAEDCFFVDCGITYSGAATTTITGLSHLNGETVVALADGDVVEGLVVSGGSVTLPRAASNVHVGLPFVAEGETLPPAVDLQDVGSGRGRPHLTSTMRVQMERTRGLKVGANSGDFTEMVQTGDDLAEPIGLFTGMEKLELFASWSPDGTVRFRQDYPLPFTILGLAPEVSIGRS